MNEKDTNFGFLFVLFVLGVFLCPKSDVKVNNYTLKIMVLTENSFAIFDWSSLVLDVLSNVVDKFQKEMQKGKGDKRPNVDGCLYLLMVGVHCQ